MLFNPWDASAVQEKLEKEGEPLFEDGSCYSNIFTGGAAEPHFCISDLGFARIFTRWRTFSFLVTVLLHIFSLIRAAALLVVEFFIAIIDFFRGLFEGHNFWKELKFVPSRVGMCILLREIIVIGAKMDITRSLPIIHMNFMGYHEQSHRRGGTSKFAHWTLKGIDNAIERIWKCANRAQKEYEFWIYSDHGQIDTIPYPQKYGESLSETVNRTLASDTVSQNDPQRNKRPGFLNRLGWRLEKMMKKLSENISSESGKIIVTDLGPYAQIYLDDENRKDVKAAAQKLLDTGKIPTVLIPRDNGSVTVFTRKGQYRLPDQTEFLAGQYVPCELPRDLVRACHHPDVGDLIISGYESSDKPVITFAMENGSHGGLGEIEYSGFFLAPKDCPVDTKKGYVRPTDIHNGVLRVLDRKIPDKYKLAPATARDDRLRIMTYNVHSCVGMDGKLSPLRIAKVIEQFNPDVVALQELDVFRKRSEHEDQAKIIAEILEMDHFFAPAIVLENEKYGDAILSRLPMKHIKTDILPGYIEGSRREPRGALWVEIQVGLKKVQVITTHLGLTFAERQLQIDALLSESWLESEQCPENIIFCGDLNFSSRSKLYKQCLRHLDEISAVAGPPGTYCGRYPFIRIDHVFYRGRLNAQSSLVGDTDWARIASDHRPLIVDFKLV
jgi:endonuclease/exonuclease/phosphatase family metal-dependent hydrolase